MCFYLLTRWRNLVLISERHIANAADDLLSRWRGLMAHDGCLWNQCGGLFKMHTSARIYCIAPHLVSSISQLQGRDKCMIHRDESELSARQTRASVESLVSSRCGCTEAIRYSAYGRLTPLLLSASSRRSTIRVSTTQARQKRQNNKRVRSLKTFLLHSNDDKCIVVLWGRL